MEASPRTKIDIYFVAQNYSGRSYWSALMKTQSREKALARISNLPLEETVTQGMKEVIGLLKTPCLVGLYADAVIPADSTFEPHKVEWHHERDNYQKPHFEKVNVLAKFLFTLIGLVSDIAYVIPVAVQNCWTSFVVTANERIEVVSGIDNSTDKERRLHLMAVTNGLSIVPSLPPLPICIYTDSEYVLTGEHGLRGWSRNWHTKHGEPLQNADLWQIVWERYQKCPMLWQRLPQEQADLCKSYAKLILEQHGIRKQKV